MTVDTESLDMKLPDTSRGGSQLWTTAELARFLCCTERHIYHLRERGLPTIRLGSLVRFDAAEALNWLARQGKTTNHSSRSGSAAPAPESSKLREGSEKFGIIAEEVQL